MTKSSCGARKRGGGTCGLAPGWGTDHPGVGKCKLHGGSTPNHRKAAAVELAHQEASRMVRAAGVDQDPIEHLLESLHMAAALVTVWGTLASTIDDNAEDQAAEAERIRGELGYELDDDDESPYKLRVKSKDPMLVLDRHGQAGIHPYVLQYEKAIERRAKLAKLCVDAGIAERQIRIAERQGQLIAQAINGILDALKIKRTPKVIQTVGRELRKLSDGDAGHPDPA